MPDSIFNDKNYCGCADSLSKDDERLPKFKEQYLKNGFDDTETWNLDVSLSKWILPRLKRFKELTRSYPGSLDTMEQWHQELEKMIDFFEMYIDTDLFHQKETHPDFISFCTYFSNLWN